MSSSISQKYWHYESKLIELLSKVPFIKKYTYDKISARITLFLLIVGTIAFINELYITIEMSFLQKETYKELNNRRLDDAVKNHRMIHDDDFHGKEWLDEKSGIVIEEFESRDKFFAKPVHVAHLYVECDVIDGVDNKKHLAKPFKFHIEFSPDEYENERRPEFGCKLIVLRKKLYHFFKESDIYHELVGKRDRDFQFTVSANVKVYNRVHEELPPSLDDIQLCFLKLETGDTVKCEFVI